MGVCPHSAGPPPDSCAHGAPTIQVAWTREYLLVEAQRNYAPQFGLSQEDFAIPRTIYS